MAQPKVLVLDFGGVLTNDFWEVLRGFARREGLVEDALVDLITKDAEGAQLLRDLESGVIGQAEFEREIAGRLGLERSGLLARIAADLRPDEAMLDAVWGAAYLEPAKAMGMHVLHHRATADTVSELRKLFGRFASASAEGEDR